MPLMAMICNIPSCWYADLRVGDMSDLVPNNKLLANALDAGSVKE